MTKQEMKDKLGQLGLKKRFKPVWEGPETGASLIETRRPPQITEGRLRGCEIALLAGGVFVIWTDQRLKAKAWAKRFGLSLALLDGEAELRVPPSLADEILPVFGAKIKQKRQLSPEKLEAMKQRLAPYRYKAILCANTAVKRDNCGPEGTGKGDSTFPPTELPGVHSSQCFSSKNAI